MTADPDKHPLTPLLLCVAVAAISTAAIFIKLCDDAPAVVIAAARLGIASMLLVPGAAAVRGRRLFAFPRAYGVHLLLAGAFLAAHFLFWITSLKHTSVLSSVIIVTTNPIFVGVASFFLFHERAGRELIAAIAIAGLGGGMIALSDSAQGGGSLYGDALALGGAVMASCYFLIGRKLRKDVHILSYITPVYATSAVILVAITLATGHSFAGYSPSTYLYFGLLAVGPQLIGHTSLNFSLRYVTATVVAVVVLGEPIGSSILAYIFLGESVTRLQVIGGVLILTGIFIALRTPRPPAR